MVAGAAIFFLFHDVMAISGPDVGNEAKKQCEKD
jgi:hypothetical protein